MSKHVELGERIQPIADALGVGFYGVDGGLEVSTWDDFNINFEDSVVDITKKIPIISYIEKKYAIIVFNLIGNLYFFTYYSVSADKIYLLVVDGARLKDKVNKLSSTMTPKDLSKFVKQTKNSMHLINRLGDAVMKSFWMYDDGLEWNVLN